MAKMPIQDGKVMLVMHQSSLEEILKIINHQIGYELACAGIPTMPNISPSTCATEHDTAVAAINHHHDVLYQRGMNQGLKGVSQRGELDLQQFEIEENADIMKEIVQLLGVFARVSLERETGVRAGKELTNMDVVGTSKKVEEARLVAALEAYRCALREKAWEMVEAKKDSEGEGALGGEKEVSHPEDLALSSEGEQ